MRKKRERERERETFKMSWLFGKKKTPKELLRENKRQIDRAIRDIDRERMSLQSQEKKLIVEMKKMAKGNQNVSPLLLALLLPLLVPLPQARNRTEDTETNFSTFLIFPTPPLPL